MSLHRVSLRGAFVILAGVCCAVALEAQSSVREMRVQVAGGFSPVEARLITAGDTLIFMSDTQPQASFFVTRNQIEQVTPGDGESVVIRFRQPVKTNEGERTRVELRAMPEDRQAFQTWFGQAGTERTSAGRRSTDSGEFPTYPARRDKMIGGDDGRLVVQQDRLAFVATNPDASREWLFSEIKKVNQKGPYRVEIEPFTGEKYSLSILGSGGMAREDFKRLEDSIARARSAR